MVRCRCILPQFRRHENPANHEFVVFSPIIDGCLQETIAQCNNCGIVHRIIDFCQSEILQSKENLSSVRTIDDICLSLPDDLVSLLKSCNSDLATFQHADFVLNNKLWETKIILSKEEVEGYATGKLLIVVSGDRFRVEPFTYSTEIKNG